MLLFLLKSGIILGSLVAALVMYVLAVLVLGLDRDENTEMLCSFTGMLLFFMAGMVAMYLMGRITLL